MELLPTHFIVFQSGRLVARRLFPQVLIRSAATETAAFGATPAFAWSRSRLRELAHCPETGLE